MGDDAAPRIRPFYDINKRYKTGSSKQSDTALMLASLDKDKLIHIVHSLFDSHPELRHDIMNYIPAPSVHTAAIVLNNLEKRVAESFPYNRHGPSRNDYTFSRVRAALVELIDTTIQYADHFTSPTAFPPASFSFLHMATTLAHRLPAWDSEENNELKRDLYRVLDECWKSASRCAASKIREGESYSLQAVKEWAKNLAEHNHYTGNLFFTDAVQEFSKRLGFLIGLPHNEIPHDVPICHHPAVQSDIARLASPPRVVGYADARR
ncbi:Cut8 six-helix bundle-domain-containing protein [Fennellomyces sp. T-0311]|nr:Cut8 six-helix bundle-domain-containing protein [Fennellomyces sp. T-0311]